MQKKFLTLSLVMHLLLGLILVVGPAFLPSRPLPQNDLQIYDIIPSVLVEDMLSGGGGVPSPEPPGPAPAQPHQAPPRSVTPDPEPPTPKVTLKEPTPLPRNIEVPKPAPVDKKNVPDTAKPEDDSIPADLDKNNAKKPVRAPIDLASLKKVNVKSTANEKNHAEEAKREALAAQKAWNQGVGSTVTRLRQGLSSGGSVDLNKVGSGSPGGTGTGGESYGNYQSAIYSIYNRMWIAPPELEDEGQVAVARIVIARDGRVTSSRITKTSGNRSMDNSVLRVLDQINKVPAPPESYNKSEITVTIEFSLKAKRLLG